MKNILISFAATIATILSTTNLKADDHADQSYFNFQVNFCKLNDGSSMEDYSNAVNSYIKWSKKNDVEVFVSIHHYIYQVIYPNDYTFSLIIYHQYIDQLLQVHHLYKY